MTMTETLVADHGAIAVERRRIADELHDEVAQILFAAHINLETTLRQTSLDPECANAITRSRDLLVRAEDAIRTAIHGLALPDSECLEVRLRHAAFLVARDFRIDVDVDIERRAAEAALRLAPVACDALVRVLREALVNSAKHAGTGRAFVRLTLTDAGRIVLRISDEGRARSRPKPRHGGHGLAALHRLMAEQGATLSVRRHRHGTTVSAVLRASSERHDKAEP
jgi:signal transduction histidine kinase